MEQVRMQDHLQMFSKQSIVAHVYNPSTWKWQDNRQTGVLSYKRVQDQPERHRSCLRNKATTKRSHWCLQFSHCSLKSWVCRFFTSGGLSACGWCKWGLLCTVSPASPMEARVATTTLGQKQGQLTKDQTPSACLPTWGPCRHEWDMLSVGLEWGPCYGQQQWSTRLGLFLTRSGQLWFHYNYRHTHWQNTRPSTDCPHGLQCLVLHIKSTDAPDFILFKPALMCLSVSDVSTSIGGLGMPAWLWGVSITRFLISLVGWHSWTDWTEAKLAGLYIAHLLML